MFPRAHAAVEVHHRLQGRQPEKGRHEVRSRPVWAAIPQGTRRQKCRWAAQNGRRLVLFQETPQSSKVDERRLLRFQHSLLSSLRFLLLTFSKELNQTKNQNQPHHSS